MFRPLRLAVSLFVLLGTLAFVQPPSADARTIELDTFRLSVDGGAFGRDRLWFGEWLADAVVLWGDGTASPQVAVIGQLGSFHLWGGCTELEIRAMSHTAVLDSVSFELCNGALPAIAPTQDIDHVFRDRRIQHVEVCLNPDGPNRQCSFESRPAIIPNIAITGRRVG